MQDAGWAWPGSAGLFAAATVTQPPTVNDWARWLLSVVVRRACKAVIMQATSATAATATTAMVTGVRRAPEELIPRDCQTLSHLSQQPHNTHWCNSLAGAPRVYLVVWADYVVAKRLR